MHADREVTQGTLCRLIEVDRIGEQPVKYRVEHGDRGGLLGTVMFELSRGETPWIAWYLDSDEREHLFDSAHLHKLGFYESPEAAALRMAAERFVPEVAESVASGTLSG